MEARKTGGDEKALLQILFQKSLAEQNLSHLRAGDSKISPIGSTLRLSAEVNKSIMMKAGHSSGPGSNENVSVLCILKTDNSTALQELFNVYHHLQELKCRQGEGHQKKPSDSCLEAATLPITHDHFTVCQLPDPSGNRAQVLAKASWKSVLQDITITATMLCTYIYTSPLKRSNHLGVRILEKAVKSTEGNALKASECLPNSALDTIQTTMRREIEYVTSKSVEGKIKKK